MGSSALCILCVLKVMLCMHTGKEEEEIQIIFFGSMFNEIEMLRSVDGFMNQDYFSLWRLYTSLRWLGASEQVVKILHIFTLYFCLAVCVVFLKYAFPFLKSFLKSHRLSNFTIFCLQRATQETQI
jgi:hypothetical protein